jgi:uncharacterized protein YndB with AHSA1/START domain
MSEFSTHIDAPPEVVFDEVSHVERHASWANPTADMRIEQTAGDGPGAASHYVSHAIFVKKPVSADIDVTRYEPPHVFELLSTQHQDGKKDTWIRHTFNCTPEDGGTRLTRTVISEPGISGSIIRFLATPAIKKDQTTSLTNLKRMLETKATTGGAA